MSYKSDVNTRFAIHLMLNLKDIGEKRFKQFWIPANYNNIYCIKPMIIEDFL